MATEYEKNTGWKYTGVCTAEVNPNLPKQENWNTEQYAIGHTDKFASSRYSKTKVATHYTEKTVYDKYGKSSKQKVADKWKEVVNVPYPIAFHDFGLNIPDNAKIKSITYQVRIRTSNNKLDVLAPVGSFRIYNNSIKKKDEGKGFFTGWDNGYYQIAPKSKKLSGTWQTISYTMDEDTLKDSGYKNSNFNTTKFGLDLHWQEPNSFKGDYDSKGVMKVGVHIAWVRVKVEYYVPTYKFSVRNSSDNIVTNVKNSVDALVPEGAKYVAQYGHKGTQSDPYPINTGNTMKLVWKFYNDSPASGGGNRIAQFDIPWGTEVLSVKTSSGTTYNSTNHTWTVPHCAKCSYTCTMTVKVEKNGLSNITLSRADQSASYWYYGHMTNVNDGTSDISILANTEAHKLELFCSTINIKGQSNNGTVLLTAYPSDESHGWIPQSDAPFTLNEELSGEGVEIISQGEYNCALKVPEATDYFVSLRYCMYPLDTGNMTVNVRETVSSEVGSATFNILDSHEFHIGIPATTGSNQIRITNHRLVSQIETDTSFIDCIVDEYDQNMIMSDCDINLHIWDDLDYIGCIPLEHLHFDPKSTYKDTLLNSTYKNKRYMGKKLATDEDITLNVRLHPQQVTTLQGLIDMDKPIPINANHKCFEGDALNHRGWCEVYSVKTELTNPHWYKCDIDVKYLTHNLKTRFNILDEGKLDDYEIPSVLSETYHSGTNLSDTSDDKFFTVDTDGTFYYAEDYEDVVIDDEERNVFSIDNGEHIYITTVNPLSHTSEVSFNWTSTILDEFKENAIERIIRIIDKDGYNLFSYQYDNIEISYVSENGEDSISEIKGEAIFTLGDIEIDRKDITYRTELAHEGDDDLDANPTDRYGSTLHFQINNGKLTVIDDGFNGREVVAENIELPVTDYYYKVEFTNRNDDGDSNAVESYLDFVVQDTILTSNYADKFGNLLVSPFPVAGRKLVFTRKGDEGTLYYYKFEEDKEFSYIIEPYYQYQNGTDLVTDTGISIFNLNYGYEIVYIQNGLVRLGFNRVDNQGHMYLGKYDPQSDSYITTNVFHLGKYTDLNLNTISDDMIEVQASDCIFTIYRGHPYIKINHMDEDIAIDTIFTRIWAEGVGSNPPEDLPVYYDLMNNHNLLPSSIGGDNTIKSDDLTIEEIIDEDNIDTNLHWYTENPPSSVETDTDITFRVADNSYPYSDEIFIEGSDCSFGTYSWSQESDGVARTIDITPTKQIMQTGDECKLYSKVTDGTNPVNNQVVYFYEAYEPTTLNLTGDKSIIQTSEEVQLTAKLKDEDGSAIEGETVYFYERIE